MGSAVKGRTREPYVPPLLLPGSQHLQERLASCWLGHYRGRYPGRSILLPPPLIIFKRYQQLSPTHAKALAQHGNFIFACRVHVAWSCGDHDGMVGNRWNLTLICKPKWETKKAPLRGLSC